jgi:pimeloyl-ACP methyl ester carboxylesterase
VRQARQTRTLLCVAAGALLWAAAVLHPAPAVARISTAQAPSLLLRQHFLRGSSRVRVAARKAQPPATAAPGAHLGPCDEAAPDGLCGTVDVPLDRAHPSRGTVPIFFEYFPHRNPGPTNEAVLATSGGPGASITQFFGGDVARFFHEGLFGPLLDTRDLILLDQRGVGRSDAIDCEQVQHGSDHIYRDVRACGQQLGFAASLYSTGEVARDIEAVRRALGIAKLDFYGGSYAGEDVQAYAARFPGHLRSAVLDSPVTTIGFNDFDPYSVKTIKRAVRLICARSENCSAERKNAAKDIRWLAHRLRRHPLEGTGYDAHGDPHHVRLTEGVLIWRILNSDAGVYVSDSEIGPAADALRAGDPVPLLRLAAEGDGPLFGDEGDPTTYSNGHNFARFCTDNPMPWDKNASEATRGRQWRAARDALPRKFFAPFSIDGWLAPFPTSPIGPDACIAWPAPGRDVEPPIPAGARLPGNVPALILAGDLEPNGADARRLRRAWPNSRFVEIANSGHHTAIDGRSDCSDAIIVNFIAELEPRDTGCASDTHFGGAPSVGRFALTAADARPAEPRHGDHSTKTDRKVATVATAAVTDAFRRTFLGFPPGPGVGLRGGTFTGDFSDPGVTDTLKGVRFASDVAVSGTSDYRFENESIDASIRVDGPGGEDGHLHVSGVWFASRHEATVLEIVGALGGHSVALRVPAT